MSTPMSIMSSASRSSASLFFFFNDTATTEIYTLSLHDALPICMGSAGQGKMTTHSQKKLDESDLIEFRNRFNLRSEEHTSELQSRQYLVCRLLLEKKKKIKKLTNYRKG